MGSEAIWALIVAVVGIGSYLVGSLFRPTRCQDADRQLEASGGRKLVGPPSSTWAQLLAAIMEDFERGRVEEAHLTRADGTTHTFTGGRQRELRGEHAPKEPK